MKTFFLKFLVLLCFCFVGQFTNAQQMEIEHDSNSASPILQLTENQVGDFTRLHFRNANTPDRWAFNARLSSTSDHVMGGYYNGFPRFLFNEDEHAFRLISDRDQPDIDLVFNLDDGAGNVGTTRGNILWEENDGEVIAQIEGFSNQVGSTAIPDKLVLSGGMINGVGANFISLMNESSDFGPEKVNVGGGSGRVRIFHNSNSSNAHLRIVEEGTGDYGRIQFTNEGSTANFAMSARPGNANPRWQVAYESEPILTVHGDDIQDGIRNSGRVGINNTNPAYALELPNTVTATVGQARAYDWDTYSDGRVKKDVHQIEKGVDMVMKLNPVSYDHYSSSFEDGQLAIADEFSHEMGFIAQEVYKVLPEAAYKPEDETKDLWSVSYERIIPVLTKAIQEQQAIIENLQDRLTAFEGVVAEK